MCSPLTERIWYWQTVIPERKILLRFFSLFACKRRGRGVCYKFGNMESVLTISWKYTTFFLPIFLTKQTPAPRVFPNVTSILLGEGPGDLGRIRQCWRLLSEEIHGPPCVRQRLNVELWTHTLPALGSISGRHILAMGWEGKFPWWFVLVSVMLLRTELTEVAHPPSMDWDARSPA